ncbi:NAD(P)/FAD-dependent oxidoreductase [Marisediminicola senii]|uniref:NAD(P)/FAD-dependent oxidoreductase n=1 Tax=Marisediminicola senii TaxID=2711233 RepID=UPI0013EA14F4|nr:FAD-dependent oxidoreductase [Marisediminicola senii]
MTPPAAPGPILIVGAGISGLACARALLDAGVPVRIVDRGRVPGGRMASRRIDDRAVDLGASYFTAEEDSAFHGVVAEWLARGVAREWTDTFQAADAGGIHESKTGPMRFASPTGLRAVVADLARAIEADHGVAVEYEHAVLEVAAGDGGTDPVTVDGDPVDGVVLAMPDPQARRLLAGDAAYSPMHGLLDGPDGWEPTIAVALRWPRREWAADLHGAFVKDSPSITFIADDGDRRSDDAPVLVAHTTASLAAAHLDDPDAVIAEVQAAVMAVLGIVDTPASTYAHRWTFARPADPHSAPFALERGIGVCGDGWGGKASVGAAWTSGDALGRAIAAQRAGTPQT